MTDHLITSVAVTNHTTSETTQHSVTDADAEVILEWANAAAAEAVVVWNALCSEEMTKERLEEIIASITVTLTTQDALEGLCYGPLVVRKKKGDIRVSFNIGDTLHI